MPKAAYVYILASRRHGTLYTGVTSNLMQRMHQHRQHLLKGFTGKYGVTRLVWFVHGEDIGAAIALEKKIKNRGRRWKVDLVEKANPDWDDLAAGWMNSGSCDFAQDDRARPHGTRPASRMHNEQTARPQEMARLSTPTFRIADPVADRAALIALNIEHVSWVFSEIEKMAGLTAREVLGAEAADYVPTIIDKVCGDAPPDGLFYLVDMDGALVAMGGLRRSAEGIAELKRVFVRPAARGHRLGEAITRRLIDDARRFGYRAVRLDTLPFMHAAQALYGSLGFVDCPPYPIEMPESFRDHVRYMQLAL